MRRNRGPTLFGETRLRYDEAMSMTIDSMRAWGQQHKVWVIAWSGGKDSTTLLTVVLHLLSEKLLEPPERLIVCYADTRMELPPLAHVAQTLITRLKDEGIEVRTVMAPMDKRFFVYMLGRGVPPPNNNTFRWCTRQIKVDPMAQEIRQVVSGAAGNVLMLTGVRQGESAIRDGRIAMSCGKDGAECGQGWYQQMSGDGFATLAPILHWRVCNVWDWLKHFAPSKKYGSWPTAMVADAYGGEEAEEVNARTGCVGCPLANKDTALDMVLRLPHWDHLRPLTELRPLYRELRLPKNRLRQPGGETRGDGSRVRNQHRMGPLTLEARLMALDRVLDIQERCNVNDRPKVDILNEEEVQRIRQLIEARTFPQKWTGEEPLASEPFVEFGQSLLFGE